MIIPAGAIRKRMIIKAFLEAGAVSGNTAKTLKEMAIIKGIGLKFDQMVKQGVIISCGDEKYYLDQRKLQ